MRTLVVGVDGSDESLRALHFAARLARDLGEGALVVVFARYIPALYLPDHVAEDEFADVLDAAEARVREAVAGELSELPVSWRMEVCDGEPSQVLCEIARDAGDGAFVIVGRRGWSTVHELLIGSVSNRLVHRGDCAVLLVP